MAKINSGPLYQGPTTREIKKKEKEEEQKKRREYVRATANQASLVEEKLREKQQEDALAAADHVLPGSDTAWSVFNTIDSQAGASPKLPAQDPAEVRRAIANGEPIRPAYVENNETGVQNWLEEVSKLSSQLAEDSAARDGVWQDSSAFDNYRREQSAATSRLLQQADVYRRYFDTNRGFYGDETADNILGQIEDSRPFLESVPRQLKSEADYWGQFLDEDEYNTYQRLSSADAVELKAWNEELGKEISSLKRQLRERTRTGLANSPDDRQEYYNRLQDSIDRKEQTRNRVLNRYYEMDNQEKLAALERDARARALYEQADTEPVDGDALLRRMLDRMNYAGRPEDDKETMDAIERMYGISPEKSGGWNQYKRDLQAAIGTFKVDRNARRDAIRALAELGYDYDRLSAYRQTQADKARYETQQEELRQKVQEHPVFSSGLSFFAAPLQAVDYLSMAAQGLMSGSADDIEHYTPLNPYNMDTTNFVSGVRGAVSEKIAEDFSNAELPRFELLGHEFGGGNVPAFLYQTAMSMGDSALQAAALGPASLAFMGGSAAATQMQDIIARGGNNQQALVGGLAAGIAEAAFEKLSLENFLKPKTISGWKSLVKETAKQAGIEASEEVFTEIANIFSDTAIMGRDSSAEIARRGYMLQGMDEKEAGKHVFLDQLSQVAEAGIGGFLSGIGMGGASSVYNYTLGGAGAPVEAMQYQNRAERQDAPGPLEQAAREMYMDGPQKTAQAVAPQAVQNITRAERTAQEGAQSAAEGIQRADADTSSKQRTQAAMDNASALVKASEVFGENGRKAFAAAWDGQTDSARYYAGFATWYQAGLDGKAQNQVRGPYAGNLSQDQRFAAYTAGQNDAAASLAKEKAAAPYSKTAGTEAGLYNAGDLNADTAGRVDAAAKLLGTRVFMVDNVAEGRANGQYSGSDILIAKDAVDPEAQVFGHEITHRVQELAPEQYRVFRQAALDNMADSATRAKIDNYLAHGMTIQYEAAMDDVVADYAGQLLEDGRVLDAFIDRHRQDRTLLEKVRDAFRSLWQKLTGAERRRAQTAEGKLSAALDAAAVQAESLREGAEGQGEVKYSLKEFKDGRRFVDVDTDQAQFDGLTQKERSLLARRIIKERFAGRVIGLDNRVFVNNRSASEYSNPVKRLSADAHEAKMRTSTELDNLMDAGDNFRTAPDGRDGHIHPQATGDFQYFDAIFKVGDAYYQGTINIMQTERGLLLKDVTQIENVTQDLRSSYGDKPQATFLRDVSMDTIPQSGEESNPQYSLKGATITRSYDQLLKENDSLRERLDYWRGQTKQTKDVTTDKKAVAAAAKSIIENYNTNLDAGDLAGRLQSLYDAMASGKADGGEIGPTYAWEQAEQIARDIAGSAVSEWSLSNEFPGLKEKLRDTRLSIGREYDGDIHNENFRREYRGKLNLTSKEGTNVDAVYAELSESYPGLFPQDITHPAEQLEQIMSVTDSLYAVEKQARFSGQMEEAVTGIANEIMEGFFDLPQTRDTMADRYEAKLDKAKAHGKQRVAETREQYQARMQKLREQNRQAVQNAIARERATRERQIQAIKDRYAQSWEDARGRRADSKARDRLLHIVRRLQNAKLPEVNRTLLNEYIGDLDTAARSMTGQTLEKLTDLRDWYSEQKANNPDFIADPKVERDLERLSKRQIADLSAQEVADLTQVLLNIENEIRTQRKLIDSQERRDVYAAGEAAIRDIEASAGSKPTGLFAFLDRNIVTETLSPLRQVRRMTGYVKDSPLTKVTRELADGQRAMYDYQMKAEQQFEKYTNDKDFTKSFAGPKAKGIQIQGIGKDGPTTVTITPAMRASLYLHSLNDQNLKHIRDGGITVPDWKLYQKGQIAEAYARGTTIRLTPSQVRSITANMTQKERAFALAAHRYFNVTSKEAVNAVSEKLKGYSLAQVDNYYPINTDSSFTRADFESIKRDGSIEGMGFLKERMNAANPVLLRDMGDVLDQSIRMHSKYAGLAIPVRNFNKLWDVTTGQWVDTGVDTDGQSAGADKDRFQYADSVKKAVKNKWGETGFRYIEKMMSDLQNGHKPAKAWAKAMSKLRSNYAGAVLTLNGSVAMKQAASYPTAAAVLGWGPLAKAMKNFGKVDLDLIAKYTPLQWYRSKGFSTQELGDMRSANRQLPKVLNWVQGVDLITTRKLWKASEYYVQDHNKALNRGSEDYYKAVADIYNQVIEETQPNYTTMQRPQLLRSDDSLLANLQMFKTQPFQNFNILYDAAGEMTAAMRRGDKGEIKQARAKVGRAVTSQLAQLAVFAGMGMAWAMFRGKRKKYEDEDGELTLQSMLAALGKDMVGGALSGIPFGSDAWELLSSKMFGDSYYGMDAVTVQALSDTIQSLGGMEELIEGTVRAASAGNKIDWRSSGIKLDGYIDDISKAAGVPYENVINLFQAVYRQVAVKTLGELQGEYAAMKLTVDPKKKSGDYYDLLYKALESGDLDSYFAIREDLPELLGKNNSDIDGAMKSRYKDKLEKDETYTLPNASYDLLGIRPNVESGEKEEKFGANNLDSKAYQDYVTQRASDYRQAETALKNSPIFKGMDEETRQKVLKAAYDLANNGALVDVSGGQYSPEDTWILDAAEAEKEGIEPWEFALWRAAKSVASDTKGPDGKTVRGETKQDHVMDWLEQSGLSEEQQEFLWGTAYTSDFDEYRENLADYRAYGPQMDAAYSDMISGLEDNPIFADMDKETREKVTNAAMDVAKQTAQAEAVDGYEYETQWIAKSGEAEAMGIAPEDYVMWHVVSYNTQSDRDADGKEISGRAKKDKLKDWLRSNTALTEQQRYWLWRQQYTKEPW